MWALPAFGALLIVGIWIATWVQVHIAESILLATAARDAETYVDSFEQYTLRAIKEADSVARLVKYEFERHGADELRRLIDAEVLTGDGIKDVTVVDERGDVIASSVTSRRINLADRQYFREHAERDSGLLDISAPVVSRATGLPVILLSRRMNHADGRFAGLVILSVAPDYFVQFYNPSALGAQGGLAFIGTDGVVRARRAGADAPALADANAAALVARAQTTSRGIFEMAGGDDGVTRFVAYSRLAGYPFIVAAAQARDEAFTEFFERRTSRLWVVSALTVVLVVFFWAITLLATRLQRREHEVQSQQRFLGTLVENLPSGIAVRSMQPHNFGQYVLWNEPNAALFRVRAEDALGRTARAIMPVGPADDVEAFDRAMLESPRVQERIEARDIPGRGRRTFHVVCAPILDSDGGVDSIMTSTTDITDERARTEELRLASKVFETTADGIMLTDRDDRIIMVNAAFTRLTGYAAADLLGRTVNDSPFRPTDLAQAKARMARMREQGFVTGEVVRARKDGKPLSLWLTATCVRDDRDAIANYVRVFTDISLLKATQEKLVRLASLDELTGLPNRRLLQDRITHALARAERNATSLALMFIDLDGFKEVNDAQGHDVGDKLLVQVAGRLANCIRASDSIGRYGGDEFAILLEDACLPGDAVNIARRVLSALSAPFDIDGLQVTTAASIGIAMTPDDGVDAAELLKNADRAMYKAKRAGRNRFEFFVAGQETPETVR